MLVVQFLAPDRMCHGVAINHSGQRCLSGHLDIYPLDVQRCMYLRLIDRINEKYKHKGKHYFSLPSFNDTHTLKECAQVWNECFEEEIEHASN